MTPLERVLERVNRNGSINDFLLPRPLLTLEEFFDGNKDPGSIGYNLGLDGDYVTEIYETFKRIRERADVAAVYVEVKQHEGLEDWPCSDTVWIITTADPSVFQDLLGKRLRGDDVFVDWPQHPVERVPVPPGYCPIGIWWD